MNIPDSYAAGYTGPITVEHHSGQFLDTTDTVNVPNGDGYTFYNIIEIVVHSRYFTRILLDRPLDYAIGDQPKTLTLMRGSVFV